MGEIREGGALLSLLTNPFLGSRNDRNTPDPGLHRPGFLGHPPQLQSGAGQASGSWTKEKATFIRKTPSKSSHPGYLIEGRYSEPEQVLSSLDWSVSSPPCKSKRF